MDIKIKKTYLRVKPMSIQQLKARIDKSLKDIEMGRITSHDDLLKEIKNWIQYLQEKNNKIFIN